MNLITRRLIGGLTIAGVVTSSAVAATTDGATTAEKVVTVKAGK